MSSLVDAIEPEKNMSIMYFNNVVMASDYLSRWCWRFKNKTRFFYLCCYIRLELLGAIIAFFWNTQNQHPWSGFQTQCSYCHFSEGQYWRLRNCSCNLQVPELFDAHKFGNQTSDDPLSFFFVLPVLFSLFLSIQQDLLYYRNWFWNFHVLVLPYHWRFKQYCYTLIELLGFSNWIRVDWSPIPIKTILWEGDKTFLHFQPLL